MRTIKILLLAMVLFVTTALQAAHHPPPTEQHDYGLVSLIKEVPQTVTAFLLPASQEIAQINEVPAGYSRQIDRRVDENKHEIIYERITRTAKYTNTIHEDPGRQTL